VLPLLTRKHFGGGGGKSATKHEYVVRFFTSLSSVPVSSKKIQYIHGGTKVAVRLTSEITSRIIEDKDTRIQRCVQAHANAVNGHYVE
jgi:hypothetical protein